MDAEKAGPKAPIICELSRCDVQFTPKRKHQVYCCPEHRREHFWDTHVVVPKSILSLQQLIELKIVTAGATTSTDTNQPVA
jgi:hypothetical protein